MSSMGCAATCTGYELLNNLDFDENNDGSITSADASYWNSGNGWSPIGTNANKYTGNFKGNGYTINNLFISRSNISQVGLFGAITGRVETLGVINANVTGQAYTGILIGRNEGNIVACYTTGAVTASGTSAADWSATSIREASPRATPPRLSAEVPRPAVCWDFGLTAL